MLIGATTSTTGISGSFSKPTAVATVAMTASPGGNFIVRCTPLKQITSNSPSAA